MTLEVDRKAMTIVQIFEVFGMWWVQVWLRAGYPKLKMLKKWKIILSLNVRNLAMSRKLYDGYEYVDSDEQYTYPNSSVLINKFEIKNQDVAHEKEYHLARNRGLDLFLSPILVHSMKDVLAIHKFLFQEMYTWAGQYRKVNISKQGNAFMALQAFDTGETYMDALIKKFHDTAYSKDAIIQQLADILDNLNYSTPFEKGTGEHNVKSFALWRLLRAIMLTSILIWTMKFIISTWMVPFMLISRNFNKCLCSFWRKRKNNDDLLQ